MILGDQSSHLQLAIGVLSGVAMSAYWSGINVSELALTNEHSRNLYMGRRFLWENTMPTGAQLVAGVAIAAATFVVDRSVGYLVVFALLTICYAATFGTHETFLR